MNNSELDISNLAKCIDSLKTCTADYKAAPSEVMKGYIADACVKRFEFTVETAWKTMKKYLKLEYGKKDEELSMNNIFRLMEGLGFALGKSGAFIMKNAMTPAMNITKKKPPNFCRLLMNLWQIVNFYMKS